MSLELVPGNSLITATPEDGRKLAVKMARLTVKATQPDEQVRARLRAVYESDASALIQISQVVATEFATIAAANSYWRGEPAKVVHDD
ncbi:hexameric tyrosine-coordinated heme protein [Lysobacter sp. TAF61]|uniref:hexameric tyrosine-coordinated heme protein n=1 Tax=Lysobacter sp. TAF61 TaxID=3233072 RepID=UPI003F99AE2C